VDRGRDRTVGGVFDRQVEGVDQGQARAALRRLGCLRRDQRGEDAQGGVDRPLGVVRKIGGDEDRADHAVAPEVLGMHRQHRASRPLDHPLGGAAEENMLQAGEPAGAEGDQLRRDRVGALQDHLRRRSHAQPDVDRDAPAGERSGRLAQPVERGLLHLLGKLRPDRHEAGHRGRHGDGVHQLDARLLLARQLGGPVGGHRRGVGEVGRHQDDRRLRGRQRGLGFHEFEYIAPSNESAA